MSYKSCRSRLRGDAFIAFFQYLLEYPTGPREVSEKQPSADDLGSPLVACRNPCVVALKKRPRCVATTARLFTTGRGSPKSRRRGLTASTTGPLPVREPACGLRVGVPAAAAVPGAPEVSSELEELAAALRPAEDETCDGLES